MNTITDEEQIRIDKEKRAARIAELAAEKDVAKIKMMSIRDRLERKFVTDEIEVDLKDDGGTFKLKFKKISSKEQDRLAHILGAGIKAIDDDVTKSETEKNAAKEAINDEIYQIIGTASLDGLDAEFWRTKTDYSVDVYLTILTKLVSGSSTPDLKYLEEINKFRK